VRGAVSPDHIHLLVSVPPLLSAAKLVQYVKGKSSRELQQDFPHLRKRYFYEERRICPAVFANRLRTDFYSCSWHTGGVRIPVAPSEDVLRRRSLAGQRMSELTGYPCNRRKRLC